MGKLCPHQNLNAMKKSILITLLILLGAQLSTFAQEEANYEHLLDKEEIDISFGLQIDLGTSALHGGNSYSEINDDVRQWGSWYVALKKIAVNDLFGPVKLHWGGGISWYNFKFDNEALRLTERADGIIFSEDNTVETKKSKLTVSYANLYLMPTYHSSNGNFKFGIGGYAGYRLGSHTKLVTVVDGDRKKDKDKNNFYINSLRYGLRLEVTAHKFHMYGNYDLNNLFADNKGPKMNAFTLGTAIDLNFKFKHTTHTSDTSFKVDWK